MAKNQQSDSSQVPHVVSGKIADAAGKAVQGLKVRAYERRLRAERELGPAVTDADGHHRIEYHIAEPSRTSSKESGSIFFLTRLSWLASMALCDDQ